MSTMTRTTTTEMEPHTKLSYLRCYRRSSKKKINMSLFELWKKELLPHNILIVGASRREHTKESWLKHLGNILKSFVTG